jgi:hypothetical protein
MTVQYLWDLKLSRRHDAINSSRAVSRVNSLRKHNVLGNLSIPIIRWHWYALLPISVCIYTSRAGSVVVARSCDWANELKWACSCWLLLKHRRFETSVNSNHLTPRSTTESPDYDTHMNSINLILIIILISAVIMLTMYKECGK